MILTVLSPDYFSCKVSHVLDVSVPSHVGDLACIPLHYTRRHVSVCPLLDVTMSDYLVWQATRRGPLMAPTFWWSHPVCPLPLRAHFKRLEHDRLELEQRLEHVSSETVLDRLRFSLGSSLSLSVASCPGEASCPAVRQPCERPQE